MNVCLYDENQVDIMSFRTECMRLARRTARQIDIPTVDLPAFLCPGIVAFTRASRPTKSIRHQHQRQQHTSSQEPGPLHSEELHPSLQKKRSNRQSNVLISRPLTSTLSPVLASKLPQQCSGCGALSQTVNSHEPGFYSLTRRSVKSYFQDDSLVVPSKTERSREEAIVADHLKALEASENATQQNVDIIRELSVAIGQKSGMRIFLFLYCNIY